MDTDESKESTKDTHIPAKREKSPSKEVLPILVCPICNRELTLDNLSFNKHVDECLNKVEVKAILKDQMYEEKSRSSTSEGSNNQPSPKRAKK